MMTYEKAREDFRQLYSQLSKQYKMELTSYSIVDNLTMDTIEFIPDRKEKLLCMTTGLHGIEGYIGSILIKFFIEHLLSKIDLNTTHIILNHSINPYGMKYRRKVNENNVDLNRNFLKSFHDLPENKGYEELKDILLPKKMTKYVIDKYKFYLTIIKLMLTKSQKVIKEAVLLGQYDYPNGFFFGGNRKEKSTDILINLFHKLMKETYNQRIFIDLHTGYGPKKQMSIVNSPLEKRTVQKMIMDFKYPYVQKANGDDFYKINGDMIDYLYHIINENDYATCFEFGTLGDHILAQLKSLRLMIQENCIYHYNTNERLNDKIKEGFNQLYCPSDKSWLEKVKQDFYQATYGILNYYHYIYKGEET